MAGTTWKHSVAFGFITGPGILGGTFGLAELLVPSEFLRWRARQTDGAPEAFARVGSAFDRVLLPEERSRSASRYLKLRLFGLALLVFLAAVELGVAAIFVALGFI